MTLEALPAAAKPRVAVLVLAAGQSRRMGGVNKLLAPLNGKPVLHHVLDGIPTTLRQDIWIVTGFEAARVRDSLGGQGLHFVHNPRFKDGLSTSLKVGIEALPDDRAGVLVMLGDMPFVQPQTVTALLTCFEESGGICLPMYQGHRGNPVLWPRAFFPAIGDLTGDQGARSLLAGHSAQVRTVSVTDDGILRDLDSPRDFEGASK
ncbi:hypothetical protein JCM17960_31710 [Magnetospira thiophila]